MKMAVATPASASLVDAVPRAAPPRAVEDDPMRLALYHHRAGDFERALIQYRAVLQKDELNAAAHNNLGMLYQERSGTPSRTTTMA
jgi:hypothetical protein